MALHLSRFDDLLLRGINECMALISSSTIEWGAQQQSTQSKEEWLVGGEQQQQQQRHRQEENMVDYNASTDRISSLVLLLRNKCFSLRHFFRIFLLFLEEIMRYYKTLHGRSKKKNIFLWLSSMRTSECWPNSLVKKFFKFSLLRR